MSYEDNRRDHGGEYGGYGRDRDERHGQSGQHQGRQQESGYRRDEFESYPPSRDEGNVSRGGYGRDAEGPAHGGGSHGGYGQSNLDDPESTGYDQPARNYSQRRHDDDNDNYNRDGRGRSDYDSGKGGQGRNEYSPQSGRQAVGSGESYVGLGNRGGDDYRTTSDAYGGEGLTSGGDYGSSNSHQNKPQHGSGTGYSGGAGGGRNESGGTGGYSAGGGGGGGGYTTGNSGNSGGRNNSSNQGTYGSMNSSNSGGTTEGSNLANWKPGQEMQFTAAEHESESNPLAKEAVGLAGQTQNFFKQGLKDMEKEVEGYVKDKLTGGSKHKNEY